MIDFGIVKPGRTLYVPFDSFAASTGAPTTISGFAVGDIKIYKDGGTTERASTSGFTLLDTDGIDFDAITGINGFSIDLSDNTTADFYQAGSRYFVVISTITVDSQTVSFVACTFSIGHPDAVANTFIATLASQTSFTLNAGPAEDDALNGMWAIIHDAASAVQCAVVQISDYTGSTKTVTLAAGATFTVAAKDNISIMGPMPLQPTVGAIQSPGRTLDVSTGGEAGIDWANVGTPGSTVGLSATTVATVTTTTTATNVTTVNGLAANVITATSIATDAITAGKIAADAIGASELAEDAVAEIQSGLATSSSLSTVATNVSTLVTVLTTGITSLAQWLGLLAGKQTGNSTALTEIKATGAGSGTYDPTTDSQEAIRDRGDAAWITATGFSTLDAAGIRNAVGLASANLDVQLAAIPTAAANADAVWDEAQSGHTNAGTFGKYVDQQLTTLFTTALTEAYRSTGGAGTAAQLMHEILQNLTEFSISGTTKTVKKFDGSTTAKTYTLDSSSTPTSITETT